MQNTYDVIVVGGGPAGLSSALSCHEKGFSVLIVERENRLGGILKQCIHDGFGLHRYKEKLTGPEYAEREIKKVQEKNIEVLLSSTVLEINDDNGTFSLILTNDKGIKIIHSHTIIFATGCRERTAKQIFVHGTRPSGIFTAGVVQNLINIHGLLPTKRCVILGSGDIGLIMARRLTVEGSKVIGVFEAKNKPTGLKRNIAQCLNDFSIPLFLSKTVTRVFGDDRLTAVEISDVDSKMCPIKGSEEIITCDALIVSVGLIPENELAEKLNVSICPRTKGPFVDNNFQTNIPGIFSVGNSLSVNDMVDYVSENGEIAAKGVELFLKSGKRKEKLISDINAGSGIASIVPQRINLLTPMDKIVFYIRSDNNYENKKLVFADKDKIIFSKELSEVNQAETIRIELDLSNSSGDIEVNII